MSKSLGEALAKGEAVIFTDEAKTLPVQVYLKSPDRALEVLGLLETKGIIKILRPAKVKDKKKLTDKEILAEQGWQIDCESPFEISSNGGGRATGEAARLIVKLWRTAR